MKKIKINQSLFSETSHSPALVDLVGEDQIKNVIDYCFIANPYYPTRPMLRELSRKLPEVIKAYPSSNPRLAQQQLAAVLNVHPDHLILGNGATELITLIEQELIEKLAIPIPTFSEYLEKLRHSGSACLYQLPENEDYLLYLDQFTNWINEQNLPAALIINPGNPTGQLISGADMLAFLKKMSHLKLILLDESFIDFSGTPQASMLPHVSEFKNLIIVRSMSKHCGVPGVRLGYCCTANNEYLKRIRKRLPIWNINTLAEVFLSMLKTTDEVYKKSIGRIVRDMQHLYRKLQKIPGYKVYPTGSNFLLIKVENGMKARELQLRLLEDFGVYVRDCSNKIGLDQYHIRVASQGRKNDQRLIDALIELSSKI